jgi:hypothetical protein
MLVGRPKSGGDQQRAESVAVEAGGVRLVVQAGPEDMGGRGMAEEFFLDGVAVEPRDGTGPACDSGPGSAGASGSRAKHSMSARRAWNKRSR